MLQLLWFPGRKGLGDGYGAPSVANGMIYLVVNEGLEQESVGLVHKLHLL